MSSNETSRSCAATSRAWALTVALLALLSAPAQANSPYGLFPEHEQVFRHLEADPRHIQLGAAYYRLQGRDEADIALGHSWGMARWYSNNDQWVWQWNLEAMAYSRFTIGGALNQFETVDFLAHLPLAARRGPFSTRVMLFHESSHLGDDYIRRTNDVGFRYSIDGLNGVLSLDAASWARLYAGATYLLHTVPVPARRSAQAGFELTSRELGLATDFPMRVFLAQDLQSHENVRWNVNSRTVAGLQLGFKKVPRYVRLYGGYFTGHSPYGQFFSRLEHYADIGISLLF